MCSLVIDSELHKTCVLQSTRIGKLSKVCHKHLEKYGFAELIRITVKYAHHLSVSTLI
jgi:hypothetical protein